MVSKTEAILPFVNIAAFIITLIINGLSNTTLIGGRTTADVSNMYPTLITPAGYVFAIWGVIYVLLAIFLVYQALPSQRGKPFQKQINGLFILTNVFNVSWLFLWQNLYLSFSIILIIGFLLSLIAIYLKLNIGKSKAPLKEKLAVHLPFSVYLGWLTIATIANITVALTAANWDGFGIAAETWAILVLAVALLITLAVILTHRDIAFSLVVIWALAGIAVNQTNSTVILTAEIGIIIIAVVLIAVLAVQRLRKRKNDSK
ncbi:MAG: TspO/MBR family protein [Candidatus Bathyarchaeia archaeon]